jgi:hypothetical protein
MWSAVFHCGKYVFFETVYDGLCHACHEVRGMTATHVRQQPNYSFRMSEIARLLAGQDNTTPLQPEPPLSGNPEKTPNP